MNKELCDPFVYTIDKRHIAAACGLRTQPSAKAFLLVHSTFMSDTGVCHLKKMGKPKEKKASRMIYHPSAEWLTLTHVYSVLLF